MGNWESDSQHIAARSIGAPSSWERPVMLAEDWRKVNQAGHESLSQALGRAICDVGAEALLAPSSRVRNGVNLVYFPKSILATSTVDILGKDQLERWLKKR